MESEDTNGVLDYTTPPSQPVGIYGWRKRCLYAFVLALMVVVIMNLALTVWILRLLHFSLDGMGKLKIVPKGFKLEGEAEFLKPVYVNEIKSKKGKSLYVQSEEGIHFMTTNKNKIQSKMLIGKDNIEATCETFRVQDSKGNVNLLLSENKVTLGSSDVNFQGDIKFDASLTTPTVRSPLDESLLIKSETSKVEISGMSGVLLSSTVGDVELNSSDDIYLSSANGVVHISSQDVFLTGVPKEDSSSPSVTPFSSSSSSSSSPSVYQLCLCENGRAFLGLPSGDCKTSSKVCN